MTIIKSISGIRGVVNNTDFNIDIIDRHMKAFSYLQPDGIILVARDSRPHGKKFSTKACIALKESGRNVLDCGIIPTPTVQFLIDKNNFSGGIIITASHNPIEWNGIKFIDSDGCFINSQKNSKLFKLAEDKKILNKIFSKGSIKKYTIGIKKHIDHTIELSVIDKHKIIKQNLKVVIDSVNGAASYALPKLLESLGCEVVQVNCSYSGIFTRGPEPLPQNLGHLKKIITSSKADIGFATDPDGDRLAILDENGNPIGEEYTLTICIDEFLMNNPTKHPIATNLSTTMAIDKISKKFNVVTKRSKVGEINVVDLMKKNNSKIGGEGNGGVILPESHYGRDSLIATALILNKMAQTKLTISEIFKSMPRFHLVKEKISLDTFDENKHIKNISNNFTKYKLITIDGIKLVWENKWIHIRKSNTEPIVRIYAEAKTKDKAQILIKKMVQILKK